MLQRINKIILINKSVRETSLNGRTHIRFNTDSRGLRKKALEIFYFESLYTPPVLKNWHAKTRAVFFLFFSEVHPRFTGILYFIFCNSTLLQDLKRIVVVSRVCVYTRNSRSFFEVEKECVHTHTRWFHSSFSLYQVGGRRGVLHTRCGGFLCENSVHYTKGNSLGRTRETLFYTLAQPVPCKVFPKRHTHR